MEHTISNGQMTLFKNLLLSEIDSSVQTKSKLESSLSRANSIHPALIENMQDALSLLDDKIKELELTLRELN